MIVPDSECVAELSIYEKLKNAGCKMSNHESDLYVQRTKESVEILETYEFRRSVTTFVSEIDGTRWFDIPFAYKPFWDEKEKIGKLIQRK